MAATAGRAVLDVVRPTLEGRRRVLAGLVFWSIVQALPTFLSGRLIASALDDGFLVGRAGAGFARLAILAVSAVIGAWATRETFARLATLVESLRDHLVERTVDGALRQGVAAGGHADTGAAARLTHHVEIAREAFANVLIVGQAFVVTTVSAVLGVVTLAPFALAFIVPPLLAALVIFAVLLVAMSDQQRTSILASERMAEATAAATAGLRDIAACGGEDVAYEQVDRSIREHARATIVLARLTGLRTFAVAVGGLLPVVLILVSGSWLVERGLSTGALVGCLTYVLTGIHPALQTMVRELGNTALWLHVVSARIVEATAPPSLTPPATRGPAVPPDPTSAGLAVRDVTFAYGPWAEPVIRALDLDVAPGDHLAIVGPSGVGKSTLAGVLTGLLEPDAGTVTVGGVPIADLDEHQRAALRVLIPQETYLFAGTLRDNLAYHRPDASDDDLAHAVDELGLGPLVDRVGGLDAQLDAGALSTGERQLVTLARAYLSPAPLVILDEASCHLDPATEARVEQAFVRRAGSLVVIAHRMTSAYRAARILVMDGDRPALGTHDELLSSSPLYRSLAGHWQ